MTSKKNLYEIKQVSRLTVFCGNWMATCVFFFPIFAWMDTWHTRRFCVEKA